MDFTTAGKAFPRRDEGVGYGETVILQIGKREKMGLSWKSGWGARKKS